MKQRIALGLGMVVGAAFGAVAVSGLNAQNAAPGAYAIVDISEISDPAVFKTLLPKSGPAMSAFGGKYVVRTENIVPVDGVAPKRFVILSFDNMDKAKAWDASAAQKEVNAIRMKSTKSRVFIVDAKVE